MIYTIFRQSPPTPISQSAWSANLEPIGTVEAKSAEDAIRAGQKMGILHPVCAPLDRSI